ncbi:hypothetical protein G4U10_000679 [Escherichia coli]|nr:hypothetical protein [Escherichia coli]
MSKNHKYQCTYSQCRLFFDPGKIYEVQSLVDARDQEIIHAIVDDQGMIWRFYAMGLATGLVYARSMSGAYASFAYVAGS